jgi:hypothetical protein
MAKPVPLKQQLQLLRQATKLRNETDDYLKSIEAKQALRWSLLRRIISQAVMQYTEMRIDAVEESLKDKSVPFWLSCIITVAVTLTPVSAVTSMFLGALTTTTQKLLTNSARASARAQKESLAFLEGYATKLGMTPIHSERLAGDIKRTDEMIAKIGKILEPEVANTLQDIAHNLDDALYKHLFQQDSSARRMTQTNAPVVTVMSSLNDWIDVQIRVENRSREILRERMRDLFDIATSPEPAKEARTKEAEARKQDRLIGELPKTSKGAIDQLTELRDQNIPASIEIAIAPDVKELMDLQLRIESMIWATTYDFTPTMKRVPFVAYDGAGPDDPVPGSYYLSPAPLPGPQPPDPKNLWKKLIERYHDPDEKKSYKDAGNLPRLGTKEHPIYDEELTKEFQEKYKTLGKGGWSPAVRLSHYFSQVLYLQLNKENKAIVQKFKGLNSTSGLKPHKFK